VDRRRKKEKLSKESPGSAATRREAKKERKRRQNREQLSNESPGAAATRREAKNERKRRQNREQLSSESPGSAATRHAAENECKRRQNREQLSTESPREAATICEAENERNRRRQREQLSNKSPGEAATRREAENERNRRRQREQLSNKSPEAAATRCEAENERNRRRQREQLSNESPEAAATRCEAGNERKRSSRASVRKETENKVVNFSTTNIIPSDPNFSAFEQNPEVAAMLWHFNSGFYRFNGIDNLTQDDPDLMQKLTDKVLAEKLTKEEQDILINDYLHGMGRGGYNGKKYDPPAHCPDHCSGQKEARDAPKITCGSCGVKEVERGHTQFFEISLDLLGVLMALSELQLQRLDALKDLPPITIVVNDDGMTKDVDLSKLQSTYMQDDGHVLNLHPEFVHKDEDLNEFTFLCHHCKTSAVDAEQIPSRSIASGVDFGDYHRI
jgi:hypothetical protein